MNIDKDIEIVKEIITHKDDYDVFFGYRIAKPYPVGAEEIQSISTVLSELSNLKWKNEIYVKSIKSHKETIEKKDKELEIWKKIAEKYSTAEQKEPVKIDYQELEKVGVELIEDDLIIVEDNILRHNSLKLSSLIFSYLMR